MKTVIKTAAGVILGMLLGGFMLNIMVSDRSSGLVPEIPIHAVGSSANEGYAIATGWLDDEMEGLFMLDTLTGDLTCHVLNQRTAKFGTLFGANVSAVMNLQQGKRPEFLLATGRANFPRGQGAARPAFSAVYVIETNSGNFAAYGVPWRRGASTLGKPQLGELVLLDAGRARSAAIRDVGE